MRPPFASLSVIIALLAAPIAARALVVPINHSARVSISGVAASVVVGNASIADVTVVDSHTVYVTGKSYGDTDLVVLDTHGHTLFSGDVTVSAAGGSVSVYRGAAKTSVACDPGCTESTELATGAGKSLTANNTMTIGAAQSAPMQTTDVAAPRP